jgi:hypothetical protein
MPNEPESGAPPLPTSQHRQRRSLISIVAPRPRRAAPSPLYAFSAAGFGNTEAQSPETRRSSRRHSSRSHSSRRPSSPDFYYPTNPIPPLPFTAPYQYKTQRVPDPQIPRQFSLYPQHVQAAMAQTSSATAQPRITQRGPSPPPLGNWPRVDALSQPVYSKPHKSSLNSHTPRAPGTHTGRITRTEPVDAPVMVKAFSPPVTAMSPPSIPPLAFTVPARSRPSGPRSHANSREWSRPPPLDLSGISTLTERSRGLIVS